MNTFPRRDVVVRRPEQPATGLAVLSGDLTVTRANAAFAALFGFSPGMVIGVAAPALFLDAVRDGVRRDLTDLADGRGTAFTGRLVGLRDGQIFLADVTGRRMSGSGLVLVVAPVHTPEPPSPAPLDELDARILEGLAAGESTVRIALQLYLSRQAVDYRIGTMVRKLDVGSRAVLVARACAVGLLSPATWPPRVPGR